jgi:hypothetical protein
VPLVLIQVGGSGDRMRELVRGSTGKQPSEKDLTPIVRALFRGNSERHDQNRKRDDD